ncbi:MAG: NfeD family protein [Acidobacteriota bacterium]
MELSDLLGVAVLLATGYVLLFAEVFLPGGIVGLLGLLVITFGVWQGFALGAGLGFGSLFLSLAIVLIGVRSVLRGRSRRGLVLADDSPRTWKAADDELSDLLGQRGSSLTPLRPSGLARIGDQRVDVVTDAAFLDAGVDLEVIEVEGARVVVAAVDVPEAARRDGVSDEDGRLPSERLVDGAERDQDDPGSVPSERLAALDTGVRR